MKPLYQRLQLWTIIFFWAIKGGANNLGTVRYLLAYLLAVLPPSPSLPYSGGLKTTT